MHPVESVINDYVDGALAPRERVDVERHLDSCPACRQLVADLQEITRAATTLEPHEPPARAWSRIVRAIALEAGRAPVVARASRARWLAVAAALVLATFVGLRFSPFGARRTTPDAPASIATTGNAVNAADALETEMRQAEQHYEKAIKGLEKIANAEQGALDPGTAATLTKNLAVIDQAIGESRAAVRSQPASEPAQQSLIENFKTKIGLLQDTVALINEMRKGNETGSARAISGLKQKGD
jgi:anti-sigma factor RsiW